MRAGAAPRGAYAAAVLAGAQFVGFVAVRDAAVARDFYEGVLGLRVIESTPFAVVLDAMGSTLRLSIVETLHTQPFTVAGWEVDDVAVAVAALAHAGVETLRFDGMDQRDDGVWAAPDGTLVAWFPDPFGNVLSVSQRPH